MNNEELIKENILLKEELILCFFLFFYAVKSAFEMLKGVKYTSSNIIFIYHSYI